MIMSQDDEVGGRHDLSDRAVGAGRFHKLPVAAASVNTALMTGCEQPIQLADGPSGSS
jgi:hypothetical protein